MADPPSPRRAARPPSTTTLAALGKAASEVAHDIDNALSAIVTHATLIRSEAPTSSAVAHAEAILRAARAAGEIVERVRGRLRERAEAPRLKVDLAALIDDALVVARARAGPRGVAITRSGADQAWVPGQPAELLQLVTNLVNNAVDASEAGAEVHVRLDAGDGLATLAVEDRGTGIPPALHERVFEPFFTTKGSQGTGLGLALARSIARSHGGELALESRIHGPEHGTTATVTLPLADPDDAELRAPSAPTGLELDGLAAGARVLIVDDDAGMREALAILFGAAGFEVTTATAVAEALGLCDVATPDLVITDLQLGAEPGSELVHALAVRAPEVPVVVVSGAVADLSDENWRGKAAAIFDKPVSPGRLIAKARELVAERRADAARSA